MFQMQARVPWLLHNAQTSVKDQWRVHSDHLQPRGACTVYPDTWSLGPSSFTLCIQQPSRWFWVSGRERRFNTSRRKIFKSQLSKNVAHWKTSRTRQLWQLCLFWAGGSKMISVRWNNSPKMRLHIRKKFFTVGMAVQGRHKIWGWPLTAGMSCSDGTRTGKGCTNK